MKKTLNLIGWTFVGLAVAALFPQMAGAGGGPVRALSFTGSTNYVYVLHTNSLNAYPFTVTAWFSTTQSTNLPGLVSKYEPAFNPNGWQLHLDNGVLRGWYFVSGFSSYVWNGSNGMNGGFVADGLWHQAAMTVDASGGKLYLDGVLKDSQPWTGTPGPPTTTKELSLGHYPTLGITYNGALDEVTVWNVALSQAQVQANKNHSLSGTEPGLIAYYRCDETGPTVADSAAAGGDNGGTWFGVPASVLSGVLPFSPAVDTLPVNIFTSSQATLNGDADPAGTNTSVWFEWGTTTNYGNLTPAQPLGNGGFYSSFSQTLRGLLGGVTYQYHAVASNTLGMATGANQNFTTALRVSMTPLTNFGGGDGWLAPGEGSPSLLGTNSNERGLAYGNSHLYLASHFGNVSILDPLTGAYLGGLDTTIVTNGPVLLNGVAAAGDGRIYAANLTTASAAFPYAIYLWTNEAAPAKLIYSGDAFLTGAHIGDDLAAIGSGNSTLLAAGYGFPPAISGNNGFAVIDQSGSLLAVGFSGTPPNAGDFHSGLTFLDSSHVLGSQGSSLYRYASFAGGNGTLLASPPFPDPAGAGSDRLLACAVVGGVALLAVQSLADAHVSIYDVTTPADPIYLAGGNNTSGALVANGNAGGALAWGGIDGNTARLYALSANQGIQAFVVTIVPVLRLASANNSTVILSWTTNAAGFSLESSTNLALPTAWTAASPTPVIVNASYVVTNTTAGTAKFYRLRK